MSKYLGRYTCKWCVEERTFRDADRLRGHVNRIHPTRVSAEQLERHILLTRYPDLDVDALVDRYLKKLTTVFMLEKEEKLYVKKYLKTIGILRGWRSEEAIANWIRRKQRMTPEELDQMKKNAKKQLIDKFLAASPEVRFRGYLNRDIAILKNRGHEDLVPAVTTLKTIKFVQKQMEKAREALEEETPAETTVMSDSERPESDPILPPPEVIPPLKRSLNE